MQLSIHISAIPLDPAPLRPDRRSDAGAVVEFSGVVRSLENGDPISGIDYEAYLPMVDREIRRIAKALHQDHPILEMAFFHRTGFVAVSETSLYIRIHSERRINAFRFLERFIDLLKQDVPIWKRVIPNPPANAPLSGQSDEKKGPAV